MRKIGLISMKYCLKESYKYDIEKNGMMNHSQASGRDL